ncbi:TRAM domain-containing protein [Phnomibacter ginsenosidimutans]|uniref:TRAM domain-containing protein n=1 Tax=Phnomibacter ginsenosidimutans TaxID=2676868 RepID=UPI001FE85E22|nr:TRAM domain-containing protein [Phnomibacter ginsenosidimutans]
MRKKKNQFVRGLELTAYAAEGKSLGRIDGKVVFVERAVPGDVVDVLLTRNKSDWAEGVPVEFISYSPDRVAPFANTLVYAAAASGKCCPTKNNWFLNNSRYMTSLPALAVWR